MSALVRPSETEVFLAVASQHRPTVRSVAREVGASIGYVHQRLVVLRAEGLVAWDARKRGTLRSLYREVAA